MKKKFTIEIQDYESGATPDQLTTDRIERVVAKMLDSDGSDGIVIVKEQVDG